MMEDDKNLTELLDVSDVAVQNDQEAIENTVQNNQEAAQNAPAPTKAAANKTPREYALERVTERLEREKNDALSRLKDYESRSIPNTHSPASSSEDDEFSLGPDELAEGKHLKKVNKRVDKEIAQLKQELYNYKQQTTAMATEVRLKQEYPDFDKVVSKANIELLKEMYPDIAESIGSSSNLYGKAVTAYELIKSKGLYVEDTFQNDRALAQRNANKPRPAVSVSPHTGDSPLSHANSFANGLTDDLKKQLFKEMVQYSKN